MINSLKTYWLFPYKQTFHFTNKSFIHIADKSHLLKMTIFDKFLDYYLSLCFYYASK